MKLWRCDLTILCGCETQVTKWNMSVSHIEIGVLILSNIKDALHQTELRTETLRRERIKHFIAKWVAV